MDRDERRDRAERNRSVALVNHAPIKFNNPYFSQPGL
jgi:hypothetical protein